MRKRNSALILPMAFAFAASCSSPGPQEAVEKETLDWMEQPDGSILASSDDELATQITRCFPKGPQFDCLAITATKPGMILLSREIRDDPNVFNGQDDFEASQAGYSCNIYMEDGMAAFGEDVNFYKEAISSEKGMLKKQDIELRPMFGGLKKASWSAREVNQFIEENGLTANRLWFDCGEVAQIIDNGSVASLETNLITYDGVFKGD